MNEVDNKVDRTYRCHEAVHCLEPHWPVSSFLLSYGCDEDMVAGVVILSHEIGVIF